MKIKAALAAHVDFSAVPDITNAAAATSAAASVVGIIIKIEIEMPIERVAASRAGSRTAPVRAARLYVQDATAVPKQWHEAARGARP